MSDSSPIRAGRKLRPETLMMSLGYKPELSEGALKCPIFQTSTFVFKSAEEGKSFFSLAYGLREKGPGEELGLIYSRLNNPDLEILENRLAVWDEAEDAAVFESGIAAITTVMFEFLRPGDLLLRSGPLYGGTHHFIKSVLPQFGIESVWFGAGDTEQEIIDKIEASGRADRLALIYVETPANPTNDLFDLEVIARVARRFSTEEKRVYTAVDNTYMGPMWQKPLRFGIDVCIYSATKFIGGHSDVIAGSLAGSSETVGRIKVLRTFLGNMAGPWTGWLLMRSLETLKVRTDCMATNANTIANRLKDHPKISKVHYLGLVEPGSVQAEIAARQCTSHGSMISFDIVGGEQAAFKFLNALKIVHLAVSLGGTESLAEHPATMTHCDIDADDRASMGIGDGLVRLSVGVENVDDLIWDIEQALDHV